MKTKSLKIGLQYFADQKEEMEQTSSELINDQKAKINFDDLIKTDVDFQSWLDGRIQKATDTAVGKAKIKWQNQQNENLSEAEKLKNMSSEEKADYFKRKWEESEAARKRKDDANNLRDQTMELFSQNSIPSEFLSTIDFMEANADQVKSRVEMLSKYEIYPKGTFEIKLTEALNQKLKQQAPEQHINNVLSVKENLEKISKDEKRTLAERISAKNKLFEIQEEK